MNLFSGNTIPRQIYLSGIFLLVIALPLSMFLMSLAQFILLGAWILEGGIKEKLKRAFTNKVFLVLAGVFVMHLIGLCYTTDFDYAFRDIRIKIPLLLLPLIFISSKPLEQKHFHFALALLITAVIISTLISLAVYAGIIHRTLHNIREISIFISHIRLALLVCVAIACCVYFLKRNNRLQIKMLFICILLYLTGFLFLLESLTGLSILVCLLIFIAFQFLYKQSHVFATIGFVVISITMLFAALQFYNYLFVDSIKTVNINYQSLPKQTALGNDYQHDTLKHDLENGNPVWIYVCEKELDSTWNSRSKLLFSGKDEMGQNIKYTLVRFLASKNLTRDAVGVAHLSNHEVRAIEKGIANVDYMNLSDIRARIRQLAYEYHQYHFTGNSSGHSVMQRVEFWKTAIFIIKKNALTGAGTGDVQIAFNNAYDKRNSSLDKASRLRAHNQYLTIAVTFGVIGLVYFIFSLGFPFLSNSKSGFLYISFLLIAILSMFTEDTLETQAGVTFFAFFNIFFYTQSSEYLNKGA